MGAEHAPVRHDVDAVAALALDDGRAQVHRAALVGGHVVVIGLSLAAHRHEAAFAAIGRNVDGRALVERDLAIRPDRDGDRAGLRAAAVVLRIAGRAGVDQRPVAQTHARLAEQRDVAAVDAARVDAAEDVHRAAVGAERQARGADAGAGAEREVARPAEHRDPAVEVPRRRERREGVEVEAPAGVDEDRGVAFLGRAVDLAADHDVAFLRDERERAGLADRAADRDPGVRADDHVAGVGLQPDAARRRRADDVAERLLVAGRLDKRARSERDVAACRLEVDHAGGRADARSLDREALALDAQDRAGRTLEGFQLRR